MIGSLAYVTTAPARGSDPDQPLLSRALQQLGVRVTVCDWDDPTVDWSVFERVVLRSTWDYPDRLAEFESWLERVAAVTDLRNQIEFFRWNLDKRYLAHLEAAGVTTIPTRFVATIEEWVAPDHPDGYVIKPAIGAGSRDAARYEHHDRDFGLAARHARRLLGEQRSILVQPFLASIAEHGEWPVVFLGGEFSHAAHKRVALPHAGRVDALFAAEDNRRATVDPAIVRVAQDALAVVIEQVGVPLYARVDMTLGVDLEPSVLEVELIEPSLFLPENPDAVERTARALAS